MSRPGQDTTEAPSQPPTAAAPQEPVVSARKTAGTRGSGLTDKLIKTIAARLADNKRVRRSIPGWGRIHIDRPLPFLCVYRRPQASSDGVAPRLLVSGPAYALIPQARTSHRALAAMIRSLATVMVDRFGAFLIVELWPEAPGEDRHEELPPRPGFHLYASRTDALAATLQTLQRKLAGVKTSRKVADVAVSQTTRVAPPGMAPVLGTRELRALGCYVIGVAVKPVYINPRTNETYPLLARSLKRQIGRALNQAFYTFSVEQTTHKPPHHHALGRRAMVKAVWEVDRRLAAVGNSFDLLLQVTPVNADAAWRQFRGSGFAKAPVFLYRPRTIDPGQMKRVLYSIPIDRVEDPTLMHLFLDKQNELDRQLTMIQDLNSRSFLHESLQLYGETKTSTVKLAKQILKLTPARERARGGYLSPREFAVRAQREIGRYRERDPAFTATAEVREDLFAGLMVSRGRLLVGKAVKISADRADALIQHEVGTHLLTYFNGKAQPFKLLFAGLPGYDQLQEGLAVLAEYLVGGLSRSRMRLLAARVLAVQGMLEGASFVEIFRLLEQTHGFAQRISFTIAMRVFRGGGLTKDAAYLRGLEQILCHVAEGLRFESFFIGKIAAAHLAVVEELVQRKILKPPPLSPLYLDRPDARDRLARVRAGISAVDLLGKKETRR